MKMTKEDKQLVREQYEKVWHDSAKMVDYCTKKTSGYIMLDDVMVTFDKPKIQTDFWFGEHTYDYDEVCDACDEASESVQYFIQRNMDGCLAKTMLDALEGRDMHGYDASFDVYVVSKHYDCQDNDCMLGYAQALRIGTDPNEYFATSSGVQDYRLLNDEERERLAEFLKGEVEKFEKRLNSYLKRYGLSKCHYGVFWADR